MQKRRYEMLLPLRFNDGRRIDEEHFEQTREELVAKFGSLNFEPSVIQGIWIHEGQRYEDALRRVTVDVEDTLENARFFAELKSTLIQRFEQIEIYIVSYPIEIV